MNTGETRFRNNLLTVAWKVNGITLCTRREVCSIAGAVVQWLRRWTWYYSSCRCEHWQQKAASNEGVYVVPAFTGLRLLEPGWRNDYVGITGNQYFSHIAKAALESVAYQTMDVLKAMEADARYFHQKNFGWMAGPGQ